MDKDFMASTVLSGIRVLDLTRVRSGPTAVRQLADWGADVIKIEIPVSLEADGALGASRDSPDFQNLHRNKRSLTLNLKDEEGISVFKKLVQNSDVVVENYRPDVKERLGIDYESLKACNPQDHSCQYLGFRTGRSLFQKTGIRSDCPGNGRIDVHHRRTGTRTDAGRDPYCRSDGRTFLCPGDPAGSDRTSAIWRGSMAPYFSASGTGVHA